MSNKTNVEIKARCKNPDKIRDILKAHKAKYIGLDCQTDTYFNCTNGRLKLRQGNIENSLIFYQRQNQAGPKVSDVSISKVTNGEDIKQVLTDALGKFIEVKKNREIYFIDNIKFHIDHLQDLGDFLEIEAIDSTGQLTKEKLQEQCKHFLSLFEIKPVDLITNSYSDLLSD